MTEKNKILFVGSECYPFIKTGGLGDVMYSLPKALNKNGLDVRVILPRYACIRQEDKDRMTYLTHFMMDLGANERTFYVGIFQIELDGVTFYFIDNEEFFSSGNPYTNIPGDVVKYTYFCKAVLAVLPVIGFYPDIIHCHDWQAALVPIFMRTLFRDTKQVRNAASILTIHNLKFQGICNCGTLRFWSGLPDEAFTQDKLGQGIDANILKGGLTYADRITTVSASYAGEIQTPEYGEGLDGHLRYHRGKLCGIVNGIDYDLYDPAADPTLSRHYTVKNVRAAKAADKLALQAELGLEQDPSKFMIGLISRLTDQKGLDLIAQILPNMLDEFTQIVILGSGDPGYETIFRDYENRWKGRVSSNIMYSDLRAHRIYAAADALLVPSRFEPCGLTQLIAMRYGTLPIVRETGGLRDTVHPYNEFEESGTGFTFDLYDAQRLLRVVNYAKEIYFTRPTSWEALRNRAMQEDFSWKSSAMQYQELYHALKPR